MHQLNFEQNRQQTIWKLKSKIAISNDTSLPLLVKTLADDYDRIIAMSIQWLLPLHKTHIFEMQGCEICDNLLGLQNQYPAAHHQSSSTSWLVQFRAKFEISNIGTTYGMLQVIFECFLVQGARCNITLPPSLCHILSTQVPAPASDRLNSHFQWKWYCNRQRLE